MCLTLERLIILEWCRYNLPISHHLPRDAACTSVSAVVWSPIRSIRYASRNPVGQTGSASRHIRNVTTHIILISSWFMLPMNSHYALESLSFCCHFCRGRSGGFWETTDLSTAGEWLIHPLAIVCILVRYDRLRSAGLLVREAHVVNGLSVTLALLAVGSIQLRTGVAIRARLVKILCLSPVGPETLPGCRWYISNDHVNCRSDSFM